MPKVSVVVPIYNIENQFLTECVESLVNQTLKDIEIILVDDGSLNPDNAKICDKFAAEDKRIKVIHKKNGGLSSARNAGFDSVTGEYFMFIDGDDWYSSDTFEVMYNKITEYNVDMVVCRSLREYPNRTETFKYIYDTDVIYDNMKLLKRDVLNFKANNASVTAKLYKTDIIRNAQLYHDEKLRQGAEGIEFNIRLYDYIKTVVFISNEFYHYRYNQNSITNCFSEDNQYFIVDCFEKIKQEIDISDIEMYNMFCYRMNYVICTTAISGYFSSTNHDSFKKACNSFEKYIRTPLVQETLKNKKSFKMLDIQRKIVILLIKFRQYPFLKFLAKKRMNSKNK